MVRALVARFAEERYSAPLIRWGTSLHERFLLPHFVLADMAEVVTDLRATASSSSCPGYCRFRVPVPADRCDQDRRCGAEPAALSSHGTLRGGGRWGYCALRGFSTERLQVAVRGSCPSGIC